MQKALLQSILYAGLLITNPAQADSVQPMSDAALKDALAAPEVQQARRLLHDPKREPEALTLFTQGAQRGNPIAQAYLGYLSERGHSLPRNARIAADWYMKSARQGFVDAQLRLGILYKNGRRIADSTRSIERNDAKALEWLQRAAEQGSAPALTQIGEMYFLYALNGQDEVSHARTHLREASAKDPWAIVLLCGTYTFWDRDSAEKEQWCGSSAKTKTATLAGDEGELILDSDQMPMGDDIPVR
jgi:TPR repeat protein